MTFNTIPIPNINFSEVPEQDAQDIYEMFFESDFNIHYLIDTPKNHIKKILFSQESSQDKIVILSYLINKLTVKLLTLEAPLNDFQRNIQESEAKYTYKVILHWLYRLIENENINIPTDLFSREDYEKVNDIIRNIDNIIEQLKIENPEHQESLSIVQDEVRKTMKFLWLGKEKWVELLMGAIAKTGIEKGILPLLNNLFHGLLTWWKHLLP